MSAVIELTGYTKPASFIIRPLDSLLNPYPQRCSILCNHPTSYRNKKIITKAKESWVIEGKMMLPCSEINKIYDSEVTGCKLKNQEGSFYNDNKRNIRTFKSRENDKNSKTDLQFELTTPRSVNLVDRDLEKSSQLYGRTVLVLDLRTDLQNEESNTLNWQTVPLESQSGSKKSDIQVENQILSRLSSETALSQRSSSQASNIEINNLSSIPKADGVENEMTKFPVQRKGKTIRKGKCRRSSAHGHLTEVREPPEPNETQVSQIDDTFLKDTIQPSDDNVRVVPDRLPKSSFQSAVASSFISLKVLKYLSRALDRETIEEEFSIKKQIVLQEALRVTSNLFISVRGACQNFVQPQRKEVFKLYSRQSARFEILDKQSLIGMTPLDYLGKHVFVSEGRKLIFSRVLSKYCNKSLNEDRYILPNDIFSALEEIIGKSLSDNQEKHLENVVGKISVPLDFRKWCGVCAIVERLLCNLPTKELDPPMWIEKADFECLDQLFDDNSINSSLLNLLNLIRDR
ncbi:uncharacterized protein LOC127276899 isoform X2 [Leptopilina boulardi]|uniref:uncharacterized protein LOC127276899 isoform X2 n=1 Tax=Leptopilina boulardi TaxID=63433 RepID=UPI0021F5D5A6|nr:uncharacterized protein LOC127276899 isoform X2 [Leptopilina boulardi]